jgi:hypothetical protein
MYGYGRTQNPLRKLQLKHWLSNCSVHARFALPDRGSVSEDPDLCSERAARHERLDTSYAPCAPRVSILHQLDPVISWIVRLLWGSTELFERGTVEWPSGGPGFVCSFFSTRISSSLASPYLGPDSGG